MTVLKSNELPRLEPDEVLLITIAGGALTAATADELEKFVSACGRGENAQHVVIDAEVTVVKVHRDDVAQGIYLVPNDPNGSSFTF